MRRAVTLLCYSVIAFSVVILSSYAFAQQSVELEGVIARIPTARILDWNGLFPEVDGADGWQEQALSVGNEVCCPAGQTEDDFVLVALNRSADNLVRLSTGTCITITEDTGSSADAVSQDSGESLFDLSLLEEDSTFEVETPTATVGVSGTIFNIVVFDANSDGDGNPATVANGDYTISQVAEISPDHSLTVDDKYPDAALGDPDTFPVPEYTLDTDDELRIIKESLNQKGKITEAVSNELKGHRDDCKDRAKELKEKYKELR